MSDLREAIQEMDRLIDAIEETGSDPDRELQGLYKARQMALERLKGSTRTPEPTRKVRLRIWTGCEEAVTPGRPVYDAIKNVPLGASPEASVAPIINNFLTTVREHPGATLIQIGR